MVVPFAETERNGRCTGVKERKENSRLNTLVCLKDIQAEVPMRQSAIQPAVQRRRVPLRSLNLFLFLSVEKVFPSPMPSVLRKAFQN